MKLGEPDDLVCAVMCALLSEEARQMFSWEDLGVPAHARNEANALADEMTRLTAFPGWADILRVAEGK